jgi:DNA-binding NtrC family response regulator
MIRLVFIGNDKKFFTILKMSIPNLRISITQFDNKCIDFIEEERADIVLLDMDSKNEKWIDLFKRIQNINKNLIILVTGSSDLSNSIVMAIKLGALDFIKKPFDPQFTVQIEKAVKIFINLSLDSNINFRNMYDELDCVIGCSPQIQDVKKSVLSYSKSEAAVFLLGESGVGKNLIAESIHKVSPRKNNAYRTLHTAALPPTLIESELYGTNTGAFTDATSRPGCFESVSGGTLFLDEIGELPVESQVKLLRILEENSITRIGGNKAIPIDVRIIAATNVNISRALKNKSFRKDLFYRISTLTITIPPLRQRKEDIPLLINHFLKDHNTDYQITDSALNKLVEYSWPGNVRELKSTLVRSQIHAGKTNPINETHIKFNII